MRTSGPPFDDHLWHIGPALCDEQGWWFTVEGVDFRRHGPYPTRAAARNAMRALFARWRRRAGARGGWAWKKTGGEWVVTLPVGAATGGVPLDRRPCAWHGPTPKKT